MNIGLPGTGIGGLFYLLCAFFMIPRELILTVKGGSTLVRWFRIFEILSIVVGILFAIEITGYALSFVIPKQSAASLTGVEQGSSLHTNVVLIFSVQFIILFILLSLVNITSFRKKILKK